MSLRNMHAMCRVNGHVRMPLQIQRDGTGTLYMNQTLVSGQDRMERPREEKIAEQGKI
jgi:hypothetical protein